MNKSISKDERKQVKKKVLLSVSALLREEFPEQRWIVEGILPEGSLSMLAARPKSGKTFLGLQLAISVSLGRPFIVKRTKKLPVLFLSYEMDKRRVKERVVKLLKHFDISEEEAREMGGRRFPLFFSFSNRFRGVSGLRRLLGLFEEKGIKIGLVLIDTYVLFKDLQEQAKEEGKSAYELESEYLAELRSLCEEKDVSVVLIYHNRKRKAISGDVTEEVLGSTGITGAVNNLFLLDRRTGSKEAVLQITGHDVGEYTLELTFEDGWFRPRTIEDREREIIELVIGYLSQVGQANQSSIASYLKSKGYKSAGEIRDILDKYSQENSYTPTYWYVSRKKRSGGGNPLKVFSLVPLPDAKQGDLFTEGVEQERRRLVERVEALISEGVISPDLFPEELGDYGIHDFKTFVERVQEVPLDVLHGYVERLESYRPQEEWDFEVDDEDYGFEF